MAQTPLEEEILKTEKLRTTILVLSQKISDFGRVSTFFGV